LAQLYYVTKILQYAIFSVVFTKMSFANMEKEYNRLEHDQPKGRQAERKYITTSWKFNQQGLT
jgi:hypothetical protein